MQTSPELREKARRHGISVELLHKRLKSGWPEEEAATRPRTKRRDWQELARRAAENDIPYRTMTARIRESQWPEERAVTEPVRKPRKSRETVTWFKDREIPVDLIKRAETNGITYRHLYGRLRQGWDPNRAATEPVQYRAKAKEGGIKGQTTIDEYIKRQRRQERARPARERW